MCSHGHTFGVCSVGVFGALFVGASRWYRVSFPITGPSYLSNTLCSVGITELAQCVYVKLSIGRVGGWGLLTWVSRPFWVSRLSLRLDLAVGDFLGFTNVLQLQQFSLLDFLHVLCDALW